MSLTTGTQCPTLSATFDQVRYGFIAHRMQVSLVASGLLGALFGVLATLSMVSVYALIIQRGRRTRLTVTVVVLCLTVLGVFASTTIYTAISFLSYQSRVLLDLVWSGLELWFRVNNDISVNVQPEGGFLRVTEDNSPLRNSCARTAALTINVILGDAIICWRACVVWHKSRAVRLICGVLLLAALGLEALNTTRDCRRTEHFSPFDTDPFINPASTAYYQPFPSQGSPVGIAASVLSLSINILAAFLVGYKAWDSRKCAGGCETVIAGRCQPQWPALMESGAVYCCIWTLVVAFQVSEFERRRKAASNSSLTVNRFLDVFGVFVNGAFVPVMAIYSTFVIFLAAKRLERSHESDPGLARAQCVRSGTPSYNLTDMVNTIATTVPSHRDSRSLRRSGMTITERQGWMIEHPSMHNV